jgi:hypothetical protein
MRYEDPKLKAVQLHRQMIDKIRLTRGPEIER